MHLFIIRPTEAQQDAVVEEGLRCEEITKHIYFRHTVVLKLTTCHPVQPAGVGTTIQRQALLADAVGQMSSPRV